MGEIHRKTPEEVAVMRRGGAMLARVLDEVVHAASAGITTKQLDAIAESGIRKHGATPAFLGYHGYPASLCTSVNDEVVHGIPSDRALREGDIIGLDIGLIFQGLYVDMAVSVGIGTIRPEHEKLLRVTQRSLDLAIAAIRPGTRLGVIGSTVQKEVERHGFGVVRDLVGHGIGTALHEDPAVPNFGSSGAGPILAPGMTLAIEPMVTAGDWRVHEAKDGWTICTDDGSASAHFEHTVLVTDDGAEILTVA